VFVKVKIGEKRILYINGTFLFVFLRNQNTKTYVVVYIALHFLFTFSGKHT